MKNKVKNKKKLPKTVKTVKVAKVPKLPKVSLLNKFVAGFLVLWAAFLITFNNSVTLDDKVSIVYLALIAAVAILAW